MRKGVNCLPTSLQCAWLQHCQFGITFHVQQNGYGMNETIPRRIRMDNWTPAETAIYQAMQKVEEAGADVRLTDAVILLQQAREMVADYVDGVEARPPAAPQPATPPAGEAEYSASTYLKRSIEAATTDDWDLANWNDVRIRPAILEAMEKYAHAHTAKAVADCKRGLMERVDAEIARLDSTYTDGSAIPKVKSLQKVRAWLAGE